MVQKKFLRKGLAGLLVLVMVTGLFPVYYKPMTAKAEATDGIRSVNLDTSYLTPSDGTWDAENDHKVYFGMYDGKPTAFRVLAVSGGAMMLDCDTILKTMAFDADNTANLEQSGGNQNGWKNSDLEKWLNGTDYYDNTSVFTSGEKNVILQTTLPAFDQDYDINSKSYKDYAATDYIYLLSAKEANELYTDENTRLKAGDSCWWLRSASVGYNGDAGCVGSKGGIGYNLVSNPNFGVSPALNLNRKSILFTSANTVSKSSDTLTEITPDSSTREWKLTLLDTTKTVKVTDGSNVTQSGDTITVPYTYTGNDVNQISVMITDKEYTASDAEILYYGKLNTELAENGTGTFTLPSGLPEGYKMYILAENVNSENYTDYASVPVEIVVAETVAAPTVDLEENTYTSNQLVSLSSMTDGADIYYSMTNDGSVPAEPTKVSTAYTGAISLIGSEGSSITYKIKAIAVKNGMIDSSVSEFTYTISIPKAGGGDASEDGGSTEGGNTGGSTGGDSTGGGHYSGGGSTGGGSYVPVPDVAITLPAETQPDAPITGEIKLEGTTDSTGNTVVSITEKNINDMYYKILAAAKKSGKEKNGITLVFKVEDGNHTANSIKINLPEAVQRAVIEKEIVNTVVVVDNPALKLALDLPAVKAIYEKAQADVNITARRQDNKALTGEAQKVIANRPVFDFKVNYGKGLVTDFGSGSVWIEIPYIPAAGEKIENLCAVYVDDEGRVTWISDSYYDTAKKAVCFVTNHFSTYGVGYIREFTGAEICDLKNLPFMRAKGKGKDAQISLYWGKVKAADGYEVYWSYCDGSKNYKKLTDTIEQSIDHTKLNTKKSYKYFVAAYKLENGQKVYIAKSPTLHVAMAQNKYTNTAQITVEKPEVILKAGKTTKLEPRMVKEDKREKLLAHTAAYRYYTTDKRVAVVSKNGKITAQKRGSCYIYVVANNGYYKKVKTIVK